MLSQSYDVELRLPASADETTRIAREAAAAGVSVVVAAGGDGTVNAVAQALAGSEVSLGILSLGTANDLARELGVPGDVRAAALVIAAGETRAIDVVDVNGRIFCGVGGLALVSQSALAVTRLKTAARAFRAGLDLLGRHVYRLSATVNLLARWRIADEMRIQYSEAATGASHVIELRAAALFVTNHRTTGGGLVLPVNADPSDGIFELCLVPQRSRHSLVVNFARLTAGSPLAEGVLVPLRATCAVVETVHNDTFIADGDVIATGSRFELRIVPGALKVRAPRS